MIAARMDSSSIFDGLGVGGDSAITGLATLVAIADILSRLKDDISTSKLDSISNVVIVMFNGESFDYIGSSRMVYDMSTDQFPRKLDNETWSQPPLLGLQNVKYLIELGQLAPPQSSADIIYIHKDPLSTSNETVNQQVPHSNRSLFIWIID